MLYRRLLRDDVHFHKASVWWYKNNKAQEFTRKLVIYQLFVIFYNKFERKPGYIKTGN